MKRMIVLDGNSIMYRAYFATAYTGNLMQARSGLYTNAIYGFVNMIQHILKTYEFDNIFVGFDKGKKTIRHQSYDAYKAGRAKTPEEFLMQIPYIKEYLDVLGIKHLELDDYEADDIVGSMATLASPLFDEVMVISGDKDLLQLAKGNVHVYLTKKGLTELECYTEENFESLMGIKSYQMVDYKGLIGDNSDNLPGVDGVGPKTAIKLLAEYDTLENIFASTSKMKGKIQESLIRDEAQSLRTKKLATLYTNVNLPYTVDDTIFNKPNNENLRSFYEKVEFTSFIKKMNSNPDDSSANEVKKEEVKPSYELFINNNERLISDLKDAKKINLEIELDGDNYYNNEILGLGLIINNHGHFIDLDHLNDQLLKDALNNLKCEIYAVDSKKTYAALSRLGINIEHYSFDLLLGAYVYNPALANNDYKSIYLEFVENNLPYLEEVYQKKTKYVIPTMEVMAKYALDKASLLDAAKSYLDAKLSEYGQLDLLYKMEIPLARVLAKMEMNGFKINTSRLEEIGKELTTNINTLQKEIYELCGEEFNISSPKQLGEILFEKLGLAGGKKNKTGYATGAEILEKLALVHPVPAKVLEYRKYSKLYSTYVVGLLEVMNKDDSKLHTIFKQALTLTGRLSSTEPNIQNIPVRTEDGRLIRSAFVPSMEGGMLVSADYSQIELRILAHMSKCVNMINMFKSNTDLHAATASKVFGVDQENVTKEMRRMAKAVNFGIVYGMSAWGLSEEINVPVYEASNFIEKYFEIFPEIRTYLDRVIAEAKVTTYTKTLYNRRRYMPEINSSNGALRQFAERTAKNAPIQGTAADIIKLAMIKVEEEIETRNLKSKLIAQVHDELIIDAAPDEIEIVKDILKTTMENIVELDVPLIVDVECGTNWDMK